MLVQKALKPRGKQVSNMLGPSNSINTRFSCLTSHQNRSFFRDVKELANLSRIRYSFLRLRRRTAYLNLLFVLRLMLKRTPAEGHPASTQTLCQKIDISLNFLVPSFQPEILGGEGETQGKHREEDDTRVESWYGSQECLVRWSLCSYASFGISNGVRQGSILSPFLFALYLDGLLSELVECGGNLFAGCLCYADDIVLLAPCPSALRMMLNICGDYASFHGLEFNASKTQLICFRQSSRCTSSASIFLNGLQLHFSDEVSHLGHILTFNLRGKNDIRATKDLNRKSNYILSTFKSVDPSVKCFLVKSFCLSLYGCSLLS